MACDTISSWQNNSRAHYGVPNTQFVKPLARINGQPGEIPDGYKIPLCFLESASLFQAMAGTPTLSDGGTAVSLDVPAGSVVGGSRFRADIGGSMNALAAAGNYLLVLTSTNNATSVAVTRTIMTVAVAIAAKVVAATINMYYDASAGLLRIQAETQVDAATSIVTLGALAFDPAVDNTLSLDVSFSVTANSQNMAATYASIGTVN